MFQRWEEVHEPDPPTLVNRLDEIIKATRAAVPSLSAFTLLGFPIFRAPRRHEQAAEVDVRSVLWVRCGRPFLSLLDNDGWCLSLLCRNASVALEVDRGTKKRIEVIGDARRSLLAYRFGP